MIKRGIALLLALCLIYSAAPVYAGAASGQKVSANAVTVMRVVGILRPRMSVVSTSRPILS